MDSFSTWTLSVRWISLIGDEDEAASVATGVNRISIVLKCEYEKCFHSLLSWRGSYLGLNGRWVKRVQQLFSKGLLPWYDGHQKAKWSESVRHCAFDLCICICLSPCVWPRVTLSAWLVCTEPLGQSLWVVGPYVMTQCCLVEQRLTASHDWLCQRGFLGWANSGVRGEWWRLGSGVGLSVVLKEIMKIVQWVRRQG